MMNNIKFNYRMDNDINNRNIIDSKEYLENIQNIPEQHIYINYRFALENIVVFERLVSQNIKVEVTIINLHNEILDIYKTIFNFIAKGGNLVYHYGGIVKKHTPEKQRRLANIKKILNDIKHRGHGCIVTGIPNYSEEKEICSLIFDERERLNSFIAIES